MRDADGATGTVASRRRRSRTSWRGKARGWMGRGGSLGALSGMEEVLASWGVWDEERSRAVVVEDLLRGCAPSGLGLGFVVVEG